MTDHLSWETLNDFVDDMLPASTRVTAELHARECADCAKALAELSATVSGAQALPSSLTPPPDLWSDVRSTIEAGKVAHLPPGRVAVPSRGVWMSPGKLAAAAVFLMTVTSSVTGLVMNSRATVVTVSEQPVLAVAASWQASERAFLTSVLELREQLEILHDHLSPGTLVKVEKALATIDLAIAEGREALLRDPSNAALSELMASNYRQKIELLRRMTQLASS
jgi:hypothetical protein